MKKLFLITGCLFFMLDAIAQDPNYEGQAKMYVRSFWREVETVKKKGVGSSSIRNMENAMSKTKEKDASYNTAPMEAEIKTWKEKEAQQVAAATEKQNQQTQKADDQRSAIWARVRFQKLLNEVFGGAEFSYNFLEKAQAENDAYKAKTEELMAMKDDIAVFKTNPKDKVEYDMLIKQMKTSYDRNFTSFLDKVDRILSESTGEKGANWENSYYEMQGYQLYYDAAQKVFPEEPLFATAYQRMTAAVNKYGSLEKMYAKTQVNKVEKIKNTKLPAAVLRDATLEKMFVDGFNKRYQQEYKGIATKAILLQSDWKTERNELTGIVTGRLRAGAIVYKGNDGKCYLISLINLYQEYIGSTFQNTKAIYAQGGQEMLCENAK